MILRACIIHLVLISLGLAQVYPWGPESQWTRASWPELKLPFPFGLLRKAALDKSCAYHSANGPFDLVHYENVERQLAKR